MNTLKCAACGQPKKGLSNKCSSCGCDLFIYYCPKCNKQLTTDQKFCPDCGVEETGKTILVSKGSATTPDELKKYESYATLAIVFAFVWPLLGVIFAAVANRVLEGTGSKLAGATKVALVLGIIFLILQIVFFSVFEVVFW